MNLNYQKLWEMLGNENKNYKATKLMLYSFCIYHFIAAKCRKTKQDFIDHTSHLVFI